MFLSAALFVALVGRGVQAGDSCTLTLQTDLDSSKEPLVLESSGDGWDFAWPESVYGKGKVTVEDGSSLLLACPGSKNYQATSGEQTATMTCSSGKLKISKTSVTNVTTACAKTYASSSIKVTEETCGSGDNTGIIAQMGFELEDGSWYPLVDACHNLERCVTLYAAHQVLGASLKGGVKSSERRSFERGSKPLFANVNPESVYVRSGQTKAFNKILGTGGAALYINTSSFLARGHLAPDADFIYNSGQLLTYYHANIAPQWQVFNAGNWLGIETAVRDLAGKIAETLDVWTGTYGILKLEDTTGEEQEIYLDATNKLIPAPELYWKLVQNAEENTCTVAVGANNPFLTSTPTTICSEVTPSGWPTLTTLKKGYVYYCTYEDFKSVVDYVPDVDCSGGLLEFP